MANRVTKRSAAHISSAAQSTCVVARASSPLYAFQVMRNLPAPEGNEMRSTMDAQYASIGGTAFTRAAFGVMEIRLRLSYVIVNWGTLKSDALKKNLAENGIGTEIYYPVPFHRQECFSSLLAKDSDYPVSNFAAEHSIALPIYPELTADQIDFVVKTIATWVHGD